MSADAANGKIDAAPVPHAAEAPVLADAQTPPFGGPHYGEEAEQPGHVIHSRPSCTLEKNQSALTGWVGVLIMFAGTLVMAWVGSEPALPAFADFWDIETRAEVSGWVQCLWEFRVPLLLLLCFAGMFLVETLVFQVQRRHFDFSRPRSVDAAAWRRIGARWLALLFCLALAAFLYLALGEYDARKWWNHDVLPWWSPEKYASSDSPASYYGHFFTFYAAAIPILLACSIPYFWMVEWCAKPNGPADEFLILAYCIKRVFRGIFLRNFRADARSALRNAHMHNLFRACLVKFFFIPLMITFCYNNFDLWQKDSPALTALWADAQPSAQPAAQPQAPDPSLGKLVAFSWNAARIEHVLIVLLITLDVAVAVVGYLASFRLLDTQITTAEPALLGWALALACYPPFNLRITGLYIPASCKESWPLELALSHPVLLLCINAAALLAMAIYTWGTFSFGLRFSNVTNRGIICCGPYKYVRHPAYAFKNMAWWCGMLPLFISAYEAFQKQADYSVWWPFFIACFGMAGTTAIYALRAITEERHLMREPHYQEYCRKVRWRFIPYVC